MQKTQDEGKTGYGGYFRQKEQHIPKEKEAADFSIDLNKVKSNGVKI